MPSNQKMSHLLRVWKNAQAVKKHCGKSLRSQITELLDLHIHGSKINPDEYYTYRLYDEHLSREAKQQFVGWRFKEQTLQFKDGRWDYPVRDKLLSQLYMENLGIPCPPIIAFSGPNERYVGEAIRYLNPDNQLREFLCQAENFPYFSKPVAASLGRDGMVIKGFDNHTDQLLLGSGKTLSFSEYQLQLKLEERGTLFQSLVTPHSALIKYFGQRLASVRVITLLENTGASIFKAVLKIPTGQSMTDNFDHGMSGNLIAEVDLASGKVKQVFSGVGIDRHSVLTHPDTEESLENLVLPDWQQLSETCMKASLAFPGLYMQHWDVALSETGPQILELNFPGDIDLLQHASGSGILDETLVQTLQKQGVDLDELIEA